MEVSGNKEEVSGNKASNKAIVVAAIIGAVATIAAALITALVVAPAKYNEGLQDGKSDAKPTLSNSTKIPTIPDGASVYNGHTYFVVEESASWFDAKKACEEMGGHLATINDKQEEDYLIQLLLSKYGKDRFQWVWLGARTNNDGVMEWITGEPFVYSNWHKNQPDSSSTGEDCLELRNYYHDEQGQPCLGEFNWNDALSSKKMYYICEWDILS